MDCLANDKKGNCTAKFIDIDAKKGCKPSLDGTTGFKRDMEWLRHSWFGHEYMWVPVDDSGLDLVPVRIDKVENLPDEVVE